MSLPSVDMSELQFQVAWPQRFSAGPPFLELYYGDQFHAVGADGVPFRALVEYYSGAPDRSGDSAFPFRCFVFNSS
jgi:hypothetical protein